MASGISYRVGGEHLIDARSVLWCVGCVSAEAIDLCGTAIGLTPQSILGPADGPSPDRTLGDPGGHMTQTIADAIRAAVTEFYAKSDGVLLLADLGNILRRTGTWPPTNESRTLGQIIDDMVPDIKLIRDPDVPAYIAVVPDGKEILATEAIEHKRRTRLLMAWPRSILLAFCLRVPVGVNVYVQTSPPFHYRIGEAANMEGFELVDAVFRLPGLYVSDFRTLPVSDAIALSKNVEGWANQHKIPPTKYRNQEKAPLPGPTTSVRLPMRDKNALERLYAAQADGLGERIVMPFDIAVFLSRIP